MTDSPKQLKPAVVPDPPKRIEVRSTDRKSIDYQTCLEAIGVQFRQHAYRKEQVRLLSGDLADPTKPGKYALNGDRWRDWRHDPLDIDNDHGWQDMCSLVEDYIYVLVQERCQLFFFREAKGKRERVDKPAVFEEAQRRVAINDQIFKKHWNPLLDWFKKLTPSNTPQDLLGQCFTVEISEEFVKQINKDYGLAEIEQYCLDWIAMVGKGVYLRTKDPSSHFPYFPVVAGEDQGIGKSRFTKIILPPPLDDECHHSGLDLAAPIVEKIMFCQGGAIIECDELAGYGKKGMAALKAFISIPLNRIRPPYGKRYENTKRHFIVIATTNDEKFLALDPSGDRRHIPMFVSRKKDWLRTEVGDRLPKALSKSRTPYWQWIKHLVEVEGETCSYEHWAKSSLEIRDALIDRSVKRPYIVEQALDELLLPQDSNPDVLTEQERIRGIYLDVPPSSSYRSIMRLLPKEIKSLYTSQFVGKVATKQGWETVKRVSVDGVKCQMKTPPKNKKVFRNSDRIPLVEKEIPINTEAKIEQELDALYLEQKRQDRQREFDPTDKDLEDNVMKFITETKTDDGWMFPIAVKQKLAPTSTIDQRKIDGIINTLVNRSVLISEPYGLSHKFRLNPDVH